MLIFFGWIGGAIVIGIIGSERKIGFAGAFFLSLILSPLIGVIITMVSPSKEDENYKEEILKATKDLSLFKPKTEEEIKTPEGGLNDIETLHNLLVKGIITQEEFDTKKSIILNKI